MRRKGQTIRAGDKTHEDIAKEFKDIYTNRQLLVPISMRDANQRAELLTSIFQVRQRKIIFLICLDLASIQCF